jgi:hypothetical protein
MREEMAIHRILYAGLLLLIALAINGRALRVGDSIEASVKANDANAASEEFPGITLCVDGAISIMSPIKITFAADGMETPWLKGDTLIWLEAHEGKVSKITVEETTTKDAFPFTLSFKWNKCTFENDEVLPMQLLFAFGSIASVAIFVAILFDSRLKQRSDKYF